MKSHSKQARQAYTRWKQERAKLITTIDKFRAMESMHGSKWVDKMVAHYEQKLAELDAREPTPTWMEKLGL